MSKDKRTLSAKEAVIEAVTAVVMGRKARFEFESVEDIDVLMSEFIEVILNERRNLINWEKAAFYAGIACGVGGAEDPSGDFHRFWTKAHSDTATVVPFEEGTIQ
jgi:hypothetical protein